MNWAGRIFLYFCKSWFVVVIAGLKVKAWRIGRFSYVFCSSNGDWEGGFNSIAISFSKLFSIKGKSNVWIDNTFSEYFFITAIWYIPYFFKQYPGKLIFLTSSGGETIGSFQNFVYQFWPYSGKKRWETIQGGYSSRKDTN